VVVTELQVYDGPARAISPSVQYHAESLVFLMLAKGVDTFWTFHNYRTSAQPFTCRRLAHERVDQEGKRAEIGAGVVSRAQIATEM
jgi:hypothetical protein